MRITERFVFVGLFAIAIDGSLSVAEKRNRPVVQRDAPDNGKNYEMCTRVFDISNMTIIKTTDSLQKGARHLKTVADRTRVTCERECCATDGCNVAILEEQNGYSVGDCFLFDCGSLDDFKCIFATHQNYVALGLTVNRIELDKTRVHEQAKHELDLKILKKPVASSANERNSDKNAATFVDQRTIQGQTGDVQPVETERKTVDVAAAVPSQSFDQEQRQQQMALNAMNDKNVLQQLPPASKSASSSDFRVEMQQPEQELHRKRPPLNAADRQYGGDTVDPSKSLMNPVINEPRWQPIRIDNAKQPFQQNSGCGQYQFPCTSGDQCIAIYDRCNGIKQCNDGSDEMYCDSRTPPENLPMNIANAQPNTKQQSGSWGTYSDQFAAQQSTYDRRPQTQVQQQQSPLQNAASYVGPLTSQRQQQQNQAAQQVVSNQQQISPQFQPPPDTAKNIQLPATPEPRQLQLQLDVATPAITNNNNLAAEKPPTAPKIIQQKLDSPSTFPVLTSPSLAAVALGLGLAALAIMLLFVSCRLRRARRRLRRGKVLDTEEGEYLVNGMYL